MLHAVVTKCEELRCSADPTTIVCDFELAAINAIHSVLGRHVAVRGCFYHLCQSTWRKIQELGLAQLYKDNNEVKVFCGMLDALAFLPVNDVQAGMSYIRDHVPDVDSKDALQTLINYFDSTYVSGTVRKIQRPSNGDGLIVRLRRIPAVFPPSLWNVHDATVNGKARTNNQCEGWNNGFAHMVGHSHPSVWVLIQALQQDQAMAEIFVIQCARGQPPVKRMKRSTAELQARLLKLCIAKRDGTKSTREVLRAIALTIRHNRQ